jgi:phosphoglucomutase
MKATTTVGGPGQVHPVAGKPAPEPLLVNVPKLVTAYYAEHPDAAEPTQRVVFGTSGHRGSALQVGFNEAHILAITQAICLYRRAHGIVGPLFLGWDTLALSEPARVTALGAPIGGLKVIAESGWFAARPSRTENIYKIYAESFRDENHLRCIVDEAQAIVNDALAAVKAGQR